MPAENNKSSQPAAIPVICGQKISVDFGQRKAVITAYFQTFYYLTSLISLIIYFKSKGSQLLHDKFTGTILCEMILEQKSKK